jgi:hypothetical protein
MPVKVSGAAISMHFDTGMLQQPLQVEEAPTQQCRCGADADQKERQRRAIAAPKPEAPPVMIAAIEASSCMQ